MSLNGPERSEKLYLDQMAHARLSEASIEILLAGNERTGEWERMRVRSKGVDMSSLQEWPRKSIAQSVGGTIQGHNATGS